MTYRVIKNFNIAPAYSDELEYSTLAAFKENVMRIYDYTEENYLQHLDNAGIVDWDQKREAYILARERKTESFDEETKTYTVIRDWDSLEQWEDHRHFSILNQGLAEFDELYIQTLVLAEEV